MLTVLDEHTREALCVHVRARMGSADVLEALYPLLLKHGSLIISGQTVAQSLSLQAYKTG